MNGPVTGFEAQDLVENGERLFSACRGALGKGFASFVKMHLKILRGQRVPDQMGVGPMRNT